LGNTNEQISMSFVDRCGIGNACVIAWQIAHGCGGFDGLARMKKRRRRERDVLREIERG